MNEQGKKRISGRRFLRGLLKGFLFLLLFIVLIVLFIHTPPAQKILRNKAVAYLERKLNTRVEIDRVSFALPKKLVLEGIYVEDQQKDTLISGGTIRASINFFKLLSNQVEIDKLHFEDITAKVKRILPDTAFNFKFIVEAFETNKSDTITSAPMKLDLDELSIKNFNAVYQDVMTGDDLVMSLKDLNVVVDSLYIFENRYYIPNIYIDGLVARFNQSRPLVEEEPVSKDIAEASRPSDLNLIFGKAELKNIDVKYANSVSAFYTDLRIGQMYAEVDEIDINSRKVYFDVFRLNDALTSIRLGEKEEARVVEREIEKEVSVQTAYDWDFRINKVDINDNTFAFENDNDPKTGYGIDYSHMRADSFTLHVDNFVLNQDSIGGIITEGHFKEKSGFVLEDLRGDVMYAYNQAYLKDLYLKTPGTELKRYAKLTYTSYQELLHNFPATQMEADIAGSYIQVKDILAFAPRLRQQAAFRDPNDTWYLDFQGNGTLASMHIDNLQFRGLRNTIIDARGTLATSNDPQRTGGTLRIHRLHTTQSDIALFTGKRLSNSKLNLPEEFDATGYISGSMNNLHTNLNISTSMGALAVNGNFTNLMYPSRVTYTATLNTRSLNVGRILRNPQIGNISANLAVNGQGLTPGSMNTKFRGTVHSIRFNNYSYRNISLNGSVAGSDLTVFTDMRDPNIDLTGTFTGNIAGTPSFRFSGMIDSLKAMPLGFSKSPVTIRGEVNASIPRITPDALDADIRITNALFVTPTQRLPLDSVHLFASRQGNIQTIALHSDVATANITGTYKYQELGFIIQNSIDPYFNITSAATRNVSPYDLTFDINVVNSPILSAFIPGLGEFETINAEGTLSSTNGINAKVVTPYIAFNKNQFHGLDVTITTTPLGLRFSGDVQRIGGAAINIYRTEFNATALNNVIDFDVNIHDKADRDKYMLAGVLTQPTPGTYSISLDPDTLMLNYEAWTVSAHNALTITGDNITANNFSIQRGDQRLSLQTVNGQLRADLSNFQISTVTGIMKNDSLQIGGSVTGIINFKNILRQPVFTSDIVVNDLSFRGDTLGKAAVKVDNLLGETYNVNGTVTGRGNDLSITGTFRPQGTNDIALNLELDVREAQLATLEGLFGGMMKNASGSISGKINIDGTAADPQITGPVKFDKASFALDILGSQFRIDGEEIVLNENGFTFEDFVIRDTANNILVLNGAIQTSNFINYYFDLDIHAENFKILNTTKKDNKIYYGELVITTDLHVDGTESKPIIDGALAVNDGTNLTVVVPQRQPSVVQREGIVEFVDFNDPVSDSLFREYDSLNFSRFTGMDVTANIEIEKEAIFNIVIDEANGDFIELQGEAQLSTGIDPSGKVTLVGTYELDRGAYEITFNFLHRRFEIQKGSRIIWLDRPTNATLDVQAVYVANTSPIDLVQSQISASTPQIVNTYRQRLPFEVHLNLSGELLHPVVTFDIVLPTDRSYGVSNDIITQVQSRLSQIRQDPGEINKQVFSLLLLNRFVGPNPFESGSNTFSATNYLRQSVSKLLTGELNKLAAGLIDGVDLTFDVTSTDDWTTGDRRSRTDLNIGITKRLLNERLTVSVGSNFELQGPKNSNQKASNVLGNIAVNYMISRDGRYMLRFYRKNEYEGVVDGYIIETGLSFLLTVDYDKFSQILRRRKNQRVEGVSENPQ